MKRFISIYLSVYLVTTIGDQARADSISVNSAGTPVSESFDRFRGTFSSLPYGFTVSKDGSSAMIEEDEDFRGVKTNSTTTGGCYAWAINSNDIAIGCQPIASDFSPGWFIASVSNSTGISIAEITIDYDIACRNNADRSSSINLEILGPNGITQVIEELSFISPETADTNPSWIISARSAKIKLPIPLGNSDIVFIRWIIDDVAGSSSRDELGINNFSITLHKPNPTVILVQ
jgi:hypothetical protein